MKSNTKSSNIKQITAYVMTSFRNIVTSFVVLLIGFSTKVSAASIYDRDTVISPPVGRNVLPGGGIQAEEIKSSFIFTKLIPFVINYALRLAIGLAVIVLIIGGYKYMTAYGDTEKQDSARKTLTYAVIGLVLAITAYGIVAIVTNIRLS